MYQSNWSLKIHPPGIPRTFDCALCPGRGEFERCLGRVGNLNRFLQGLTYLPLLVNNSFKRVFQRSLKVSSQHISLWKVWTVFDWRRNLFLRRGISELIGGVFERLFSPEGREFEQANLQKFKCPGGWMLRLRFDWYISFFVFLLFFRLNEPRYATLPNIMVCNFYQSILLMLVDVAVVVLRSSL